MRISLAACEIVVTDKHMQYSKHGQNNKGKTMNKSIRVWITAACATVFFVNSLSAQEEQNAPTTLVDIFVCNYNDGNDMDDLLAVTESWNNWADENNISDYTAILLTPNLFSDQTAFDVGWLGVSPNGAAMGATEALWLAEGQDLQADFAEVIDCTSHTRYAVVPIRTPSEPPPEDANGPGLLSFSDCALHEERIVPEAMDALGEWTEYLAEQGHDGFGGMLFGVAGQRDDINFNFKWVQGFPDADAYGRLTDIITRGGFLRAGELLGRLLDCDSPRVYVTNQVRQAAQEE